MSTYALERLNARPAGRKHTTVAIYSTAAAARSAVTRLYNMGLDMEKVSLVSSDFQPGGHATDLVAEHSVAERPHRGRTEDSTAQDETNEVSAIGAGLIRLGVSRENAMRYELDIRQGRSLLVVHGSLAETCRAAALLEITSHHGLAEHEA